MSNIKHALFCQVKNKGILVGARRYDSNILWFLSTPDHGPTRCAGTSSCPRAERWAVSLEDQAPLLKNNALSTGTLPWISRQRGYSPILVSKSIIHAILLDIVISISYINHISPNTKSGNKSYRIR